MAIEIKIHGETFYHVGTVIDETVYHLLSVSAEENGHSLSDELRSVLFEYFKKELGIDDFLED